MIHPSEQGGRIFFRCCLGTTQLTERKVYQKICQSLREGAPELRQHIDIDVTSERNDITT
ncbi:MAG: hypothetical protein ACI8RD_007015 [Bacillariaceae sp.]|jgi:hypothetical protein